MRNRAFLVERKKLVLRSIQAAHAAIRFCPDTKVERDEAVADGSGMYERITAPIDKRTNQATVAEVGTALLRTGHVITY